MSYNINNNEDYKKWLAVISKDLDPETQKLLNNLNNEDLWKVHPFTEKNNYNIDDWKSVDTNENNQYSYDQTNYHTGYRRSHVSPGATLAGMIILFAIFAICILSCGLLPKYCRKRSPMFSSNKHLKNFIYARFNLHFFIFILYLT